jgi:hypothetical protein
VIAWSAPQPYHQEAVPFINHALNHCFGKFTEGPLTGQLKPWPFTHVHAETSRIYLIAARPSDEPPPQRPTQAAVRLCSGHCGAVGLCHVCVAV